MQPMLRMSCRIVVQNAFSSMPNEESTRKKKQHGMLAEWGAADGMTSEQHKWRVKFTLNKLVHNILDIMCVIPNFRENIRRHFQRTWFWTTLKALRVRLLKFYRTNSCKRKVQVKVEFLSYPWNFFLFFFSTDLTQFCFFVISFYLRVIKCFFTQRELPFLEKRAAMYILAYCGARSL